jgi:competence protein ComEC
VSEIESRLELARPYVAAGAVCAGLVAANVARPGGTSIAIAVCLCATAAWIARGPARIAFAALGLAAAAWWTGGARLDVLDGSALVGRVGHVDATIAEVSGPARRGSFALRVPVDVRRFGAMQVDEPALLELPRGRAPPQGARIEVIAEVREPRPAADGFDERGWLARQGVHVVLHGRSWRAVGYRGGFGAVADTLHAWLARGAASGLHGERAAVIAGVVLGADEGLSQPLRDRFRSSGLYHLLAVSGQNVALLAGGLLLLASTLGVSRWLGELWVLGGIAGYVLAVGLQPSVVRAGVAGALGSLAWLAARPRDRWYFLLLGAVALLAWNPYTVRDPGFQLSFAAVASIFVLVPRIQRLLEGYPIPSSIVAMVAVSSACGLVTAPILLIDFGRVPIFSVLANLLAEPAVPPLLGLGLAAAIVHPLSAALAAAIAWINGWFAAYLAWCARFVGGLPSAQVGSARVVILAAAAIALVWLLARTRPWRLRRAGELCGAGVALALGWRLLA